VEVFTCIFAKENVNGVLIKINFNYKNVKKNQAANSKFSWQALRKNVKTNNLLFLYFKRNNCLYFLIFIP